MSTTSIDTYYNNNNTYINWDKSHTATCVCDKGYTGPSCNMRMCPKGVDPLSEFTDWRTIELSTKSTTGRLGGYFKFKFYDEDFIFSADSDVWEDEECTASFVGLLNVGVVRCTASSALDIYGSTTYLIQFREWPLLPNTENNFRTNSGNPPNSAFSCDVSAITGSTDAACTITDTGGTSYPGRWFIVLIVLYTAGCIYVD